METSLSDPGLQSDALALNEVDLASRNNTKPFGPQGCLLLGNVDPWDKSKYSASQRGFLIEDRLGGNLPNNFPIIDVFDKKSRTIASIKTIDTDLASYKKPGKLRSRVKGFVNKLEGFKAAEYSGTNIRPQDFKNRQLVLGTPKGKINQEQKDAIEEVTKEAALRGITVIWKMVG